MATFSRIQTEVDKTEGKRKRSQQKDFFVIEISEVNSQRYPRTLFACDTLEEALNLCKGMNTDAGHTRFAVQGRPGLGED